MQRCCCHLFLSASGFAVFAQRKQVCKITYLEPYLALLIDPMERRRSQSF